MSEAGREDIDATGDDIVDASFCTRTEDFFSPASRDVVGRYLGGFLDQLIITPTELVHSAKYQKRLHDAGRTLMNAVDRIGSLQARRKGTSPAARVRELHDLISKASRKVWDDDKEHPAPAVKPESFAEAVARLPASEQAYTGSRMLVEHLSAQKVWKDKVAVLVGMYALTEGREAAPLIEMPLAECLRSDSALDQLFGLPERIEERCSDLADLWKGTWQPREAAHPAMAEINARIAAGGLPVVKAAAEHALLRTLAGRMPLRSAEPEAEIQAVTDLFRRMWTGQALIGGAKALALLEKRQARHINTETVTDLLRERKALADRLLFLMTLSGQCVGNGNRATVKAFIAHYFGDRDFVPRVVAGMEPPVPKLQTLTQTHRLLKASWLPDEEKNAHAALVETAQADLLRRSRVFEQVDKKSGGPAQKALTLIDLARRGTFIEGANFDAAGRLIQGYLHDPQFMAEYIGAADPDERERKLSLLSRTLASLGLPWG